MEELIVADEVTKLLKANAPRNAQGAIFLPVSEAVLVLTAEDRLQIFENGEFRDFGEYEEEVQLYIYDQVFATRFHLETLVRENLIEHQDTEDMEWVVAPQPIFAPSHEEGKPPVEMGAFAIAKEVQLEGKELRSVLFISPDKTYATLSAYMSDSDPEKEIAKNDLLLIAEEMKKFISRL